MAADTAKLLASLDLQDAMSPKLRSAMGNVANAEGRVASLGTRLSGFASNLRGNVGNALSTFGGRVKQIGLGLAAGLGIGGLLSFTGALRAALDRARTFGDEVVRLQRVTGLAAPTVSALAGVFEHFGIDAATATRAIGLLEKNVGNLTATKKKAIAFEKLYGLSLLDSNGKVKDANRLLLDTASFFNNKSIPAQTKAAALQKLYGRGWQELLPVLAAGKSGIAAVEAELAKMGLTLTTDNLKALRENKDATRNWNSALAGLELQIGLNLLPHLTDLAKVATSFVTSHRTDIVNFFNNAADAAGSAVQTIGGLVGTISGFWNSIPAGFRDLLVKGVVADRTIKFLFGFSPIGTAVRGIEGGLAGLLGRVISASPIGRVLGGIGVPHVWVDNLGPGGLGSGIPSALTAAGGITAATIGAAIAAVATGAGLALIMAGVGEWILANSSDPNGVIGRTATAAARGLNPAGVDQTSRTGGPSANALQPGTDIRHYGDRFIAGLGMVAGNLGSEERNLTSAMSRLTASFSKPAWLKRWEDSVFHASNSLSKSIAKAEASLTSGKNVKAVAEYLGAHIGVGGVGAGGLQIAERTIAELKTALGHTSDPATRRAIVEAIDKLKARLPRLADNAKNLHLAEKIAASGESQKEKLKDLSKIMDDVRKHGDRTTQHRLQTLINDVKHQKTTFIAKTNNYIRITNTGTRYRIATTTTSSGAYAGYNGTPTRR